MDWHQMLKKIYIKLERAGFPQIAGEIHDAQLSGGTAGEIFDIVLTTLRQLKSENPKAYQVIEGEADELFAFARSIGYLA
jgi:hypothetical protein